MSTMRFDVGGHGPLMPGAKPIIRGWNPRPSTDPMPRNNAPAAGGASTWSGGSPQARSGGSPQARPAAPAPAKPKGPGLLDGLRSFVGKHFTADWLTLPKASRDWSVRTDENSTSAPALSGRTYQGPLRESSDPGPGPIRGHTDPDLNKQAKAAQASIMQGRITSENEMNAARRDSKFDGSTSVMDETAYRNLTPRARAAVDFNGMLQAAIAKDNALLGNRDKDKSGHLTMAEAGDLANDNQGYKTAYQRIFGREAGADRTYAPNTLGLLNTLDLTDSGGTLEDYLRGHGYVNSNEMRGKAVEKGALQGPMTGEAAKTQARENLVSKVSDGMLRLQETLASGKVNLSGASRAVGSTGIMDDQQREGMVESMRRSLVSEDANNRLRLRGDNPRFDPAGGIDFTNTIDADTRDRYQRMEQTLAAAMSSGTPTDLLRNSVELRKLGFGAADGTTAGLDPDEFAQYVAEIEGSAREAGRTIEEDIMAQVAGGAGGIR